MDRNQILRQLVDLVKLMSHATIYNVGNKIDDMDADALADLEVAIDRLNDLCVED